MSADSSKVGLLLVDAHRPNLVAFEAVLESADRELVLVGSGADALRELAIRDFAVILMAVQMPVMDGFETAAKIKALEAARHVPIILVTAIGHDASHLTRAYESGAVDVLHRPVDPGILRAKVSVFVDLFQAREQVRRQEAERLAASLVLADQLQQQFLSTLGQELRPPLNAILGWIRMLRDGSIRESQRGRALETVERNASAQLELIEEMIDISRMTSGTLTLELGIVDLRRTVELAIEAVRPAALEKQVMLLSELEGDVAPLSGDAERLRQIVHRLVSNALSSTPTDGVVTVTLCNVGSLVEIAVADSGIGIEAEVLPRLFDRFDGKIAPTPRAAGGLGVSLAIVRHLTELHGGTIRVESGGPGLGCRFIVNLPAEGRKPRNDDEVR